MKPPLIIYHKGCNDGFCGAWIAHGALTDQGNDVELLSAQYGDTAPDVSSRDVYIVDFSYKREELLRMEKQATGIVVLDHHKTAEKELSDLSFCIFDMTKSGAILAWEYFHRGVKAPRLVKYVQDRDLWQWKLWGSEEINLYIDARDQSMEDWDYLHKSLENDSLRVMLYDAGVAIQQYREKLIKRISSNAQFCDLAGYEALCINTPLFQSEVAGDLAEKSLFGIVYYFDGKKHIYSLRSRKNGVDVSEIAKTFGGGGHPKAAGFSSEKNVLEIKEEPRD